MSNKEILTLVSSVAGIDIDHWDGDTPMYIVYYRGHVEHYEEWNPLEDDGDAFRLGAKLSIFFRRDFTHILGELIYGGMDRCAAARLAIVQIAASLAVKPTDKS
jgi:hypothetical protein